MTASHIGRFAAALYDFAEAVHFDAVDAELVRLRDPKFDTAMLLARLRGNLMTEGRKVVDLLQGDGVPPTADNIGLKLVLIVGTARPRSKFVPWGLDDMTVEQMIMVVAKELATDGPKRV